MSVCFGSNSGHSAAGHSVRLMVTQFVKPYVKTSKNSVADAEAICEAVNRPNMRFVPIKSIEQQAILSMQRVCQGFVKARTVQANQIRVTNAVHGERQVSGSFTRVVSCRIAERMPTIA
jgi:transposase